MTSKLNSQVKDFHRKFGHPVQSEPAVPSDEQIRFRLKLISEEFLELFKACGIQDGNIEAILDSMIKDAEIEIDLPEFADAMGDLDYVVEGTRIVFGIDGESIADEIQRANMDKDAVYVHTKDGYHKGSNIKPTKPATWNPPQIEEVLRKQGWKG